MGFRIHEYSIRNVFKPRWWQLRLRYRLWRSYRRGQKLHKLISEEGRKRVDELERKLEQSVIYGDASHTPGFITEEDQAMPSCPYCGVTSESAPTQAAGDAISKHVPKCPLNPANRPSGSESKKRGKR